VAALGDSIRAKLDAGLLPRDTPVKLWAAYGSGQPCSACEEPILARQIEYELEYPEHQAPVVRFHAGCHGVWEAERVRRGLSRAPKRDDRETSKPSRHPGPERPTDVAALVAAIKSLILERPLCLSCIAKKVDTTELAALRTIEPLQARVRLIAQRGARCRACDSTVGPVYSIDRAG
jgi:hypothetical protein